MAALHGLVIAAALALVSLACGPDGPDAGGPTVATDGRDTNTDTSADTNTDSRSAADAPADASPVAVANASPDPAMVAAGREVALDSGCAACHGGDFGGATGPSWIGLAGSTVMLADGRELVADEAYLRRAIVEPDADIVDGYIVKMPVVALDDAEIDALIAFISSLGSGSD
jgi:mono/diheme cytochrome c family protein